MVSNIDFLSTLDTTSDQDMEDYDDYDDLDDLDNQILTLKKQIAESQKNVSNYKNKIADDEAYIQKLKHNIEVAQSTYQEVQDGANFSKRYYCYQSILSSFNYSVIEKEISMLRKFILPKILSFPPGQRDQIERIFNQIVSQGTTEFVQTPVQDEETKSEDQASLASVSTGQNSFNETIFMPGLNPANFYSIFEAEKKVVQTPFGPLTVSAFKSSDITSEKNPSSLTFGDRSHDQSQRAPLTFSDFSTGQNVFDKIKKDQDERTYQPFTGLTGKIIPQTAFSAAMTRPRK